MRENGNTDEKQIHIREHGDCTIRNSADEVHRKALVQSTPTFESHNAFRRVDEPLP